MNIVRNQQDKLPVAKFFAWKSRDISTAAMQAIVLSYLSIFCTNSLGMNPVLVGTLLMVSKICDGIPDLFAGYLIDNTQTKLGKARPYELAVIGVWVCTGLLFFTSPEWSEAVKAVWVFAMYTLTFSIFNTLLNASQTPYMIRAFSNNRQVIAKVASFGGVVSMLGAMVVSVSFPILMGKLATNTAGWRLLILIYAIPLCLLGLLRFIFVKEDPSVDVGNSKRVHVKEIFTMLAKNKYCLIYAAITGLYEISVGLGAGTYFFTYIIGDISKMGIVSLFSILVLPVMFSFPAMMRKMNVAKLFTIFAAIAFVGNVIIFVGDAFFPAVIAGSLLRALLNLPLGYLGPLVVMQLATYNEYIGLPRMESSSSVVGSFTSKIGAGIGAGLCGLLLGAVGFVSSTSGIAAEQSDSVLMMIRFLYSVLPGICTALIVFLSVMLGKLGKQIPQMEREIAERKEVAVQKK